MLQHLALRNFRNFEHLDVDLPSAGLVVVGENGHGKTNLLEAISYLGLFRSVRGARDTDAIRFGAPAFHIRARLAPPARYATVSVGYERSTKRKRATLDGVDQDRLSLAFGALPSVCFSPADVALVAGGPAERRHFLDVVLALSVQGYLAALQRYRSALRQRNAALRIAQRAGAQRAGSPRAGAQSAGAQHADVQNAGAQGASVQNARAQNAGASSRDPHEASVSVWEPALAHFGAVLASRRRAWCEAHAVQFTDLCTAIGERSSVSLRYAGGDAGMTAVDFERAYQSAFDEQRASECRRGVTLVGPHRDDVHLLLGHADLRAFGSAGQQRSAAIALRMLELSTVREAIGTPPLLLLDDPFAELDAKRSARILLLLEQSGVGQTMLAVPREEDIPRSFTRLERRVMVDGALK